MCCGCEEPSIRAYSKGPFPLIELSTPNPQRQRTRDGRKHANLPDGGGGHVAIAKPTGRPGRCRRSRWTWDPPVDHGGLQRHFSRRRRLVESVFREPFCRTAVEACCQPCSSAARSPTHRTSPLSFKLPWTAQLSLSTSLPAHFVPNPTDDSFSR